MTASFADRLQPAPRDGGFSMDGWVIWGATVLKGNDGNYHAFASRWDADLDFACWQTNSHVVRGTAQTPTGPFELRDVVVPQGSERAWDRNAHNPSITRAPDGTLLLFYYGSQFDGPLPTTGGPGASNWKEGSIGLATADSVAGPWTFHGPVHEGANPVPVVHADGSIDVFTRDHDFEMSVYRSPHWSETAEYELRAERILQPLEDHYVWYSEDTGQYHLVAKDMQVHHDSHDGYGPSYAGFHATSDDGVEWTVSDPPLAYPHRVDGDRQLVVEWDDGTETTFPNVERPQLLIEDGVPTCLYVAVIDPGASVRAEHDFAALQSHRSDPERVWNVAIPLE